MEGILEKLFLKLERLWSFDSEVMGCDLVHFPGSWWHGNDQFLEHSAVCQKSWFHETKCILMP